MDIDYPAIARGFGAEARRVDSPDGLAPALQWALEARSSTPVVLDVLTTRDPAKMLPGIDSRTKLNAAEPVLAGATANLRAEGTP